MTHDSGARYPGGEDMKKRMKITVSKAFIQNVFSGWH